jgi:hypothetical protein
MDPTIKKTEMDHFNLFIIGDTRTSEFELRLKIVEVQWFEKISDESCLMNFSSVHDSEHFPKSNYQPEISYG